MRFLESFLREIVDFVPFSQKSGSKSTKNNKFHQILHQIFKKFLWHFVFPFPVPVRLRHFRSALPFPFSSPSSLSSFLLPSSCPSSPFPAFFLPFSFLLLPFSFLLPSSSLSSFLSSFFPPFYLPFLPSPSLPCLYFMVVLGLILGIACVISHRFPPFF